MLEVKKVRKFSFEGELVCIADELFEYIGAKTSLESTIKDKNLQKGYDFEVIPSYILNNKIPISKYNDRNEITLLKPSGILKILNNRRQTESLDIARAFNLQLNFIKEREYLNVIKAAFNDYICKQQYYVSKEDSKGYFIDLYIYGEDKNIAVEVDENGHSNYDIEFEKEREEYIKSVLGCEFVRFNPDDKNFNIGKVINKIMKIKNTPIITKYKYIDTDISDNEFIEDLIYDVENADIKIIHLIESLQVENVYNDLGLKLNFKKSIYNDNGFIVLLDNTPLINTNDIVSEEICSNDNGPYLSIIVKHNSLLLDKDIYLEFKLDTHTIHIKLLKGLRKALYIKEYLDYISKCDSLIR